MSLQEAPHPFLFLGNPVALHVPWKCHSLSGVAAPLPYGTPLREAALPPTLRSRGGLDVWTVLVVVVTGRQNGNQLCGIMKTV